MQYLTNEQVVADIGYFVASIKADLDSQYGESGSRKWLIVGGSYGANAVSWLNMKYPHIAEATLADSAPVLAVE